VNLTDTQRAQLNSARRRVTSAQHMPTEAGLLVQLELAAEEITAVLRSDAATQRWADRDRKPEKARGMS
jgi:hypothetical protein